MGLPALVLVHGGAHAADCWDLTIDEIHALEPELTVLAVDLPGRRNKPGDLSTLTISDWVNSVVADVDDAGLSDVVIVGHSMAGLTVPGVVTKLGASRVRELILAAACVPAEGTTMVDTLTGVVAMIARRNGRKGAPHRLPPVVPRLVFYNGASQAQWKFIAGRLCPDSSRIPGETIFRPGMPDEVPRTWIMTLRDRTNPAKAQNKCIAAIGGVQTVISIDTGHGLMVSEPKRLAEILVERCRRYS